MSLFPFCTLHLLYFNPEYQSLCPRWSCSSPGQHLFGTVPGKQLVCCSRDAATMVAGSLPVSYLSSEVGGANVRGGAFTGIYEVSSWGCKGRSGLTHCWSPSSLWSALIHSWTIHHVPCSALGAGTSLEWPYWTKFHTENCILFSHKTTDRVKFRIILPGHPRQIRQKQDRGTWRSTVHGVSKSQMRLSDWADTHIQAEAGQSGDEISHCICCCCCC